MEQLLDRTLEEIDGYLALGMAGEAAGLLEALPRELHTHPEVMAAQVEVSLASGQWEEAASVARSLTSFMAEEPQFWIWLAYATRRAGSLKAAEAVLDRAADHHPDFAFLHYELARCAALRGRAEDARERLNQALELDPHMRLLAMDDPALGCLGLA